MSSLRISAQNRALGVSLADGDTGRSDAVDGASFSLALGAAALAPKEGAALLGDSAGQGSDSQPPPDKSNGKRGAIDVVASTLVVQMLPSAFPDALSVPATATAGDATAVNVDTVAAGAQATGAATARSVDTVAVGPQAMGAATVGSVDTVAAGAQATAGTVAACSSTAPLTTTGVVAAAAIATTVPSALATTDVLSAAVATSGGASASPVTGILATAATPTSGSSALSATGVVAAAAIATTAPSGLPATGALVATAIATSIPSASTPPNATAASATTSNPTRPGKWPLAQTQLATGQVSTGMPAATPTASVLQSAMPAIGEAAPVIAASPVTALQGAVVAVQAQIAQDTAISRVTSVPLPSSSVLTAAAVNAVADYGGGASPFIPTQTGPQTLRVSARETLSASDVLTSPMQAILSSGAVLATPGAVGPSLPVSPAGAWPPDPFAPIKSPTDIGNVNAAVPIAVTSDNASLASAPSLASAASLGTASAAAVPDQVAGELVRMASSGPREMVLRLHPPELGDLTVRVAVSGRDVSAWFTSPLPHVQTAISTALGQLQTSLGNAGYNLDNAWVGGGSGERQPTGNAPAPTVPLPSAAAAAALPPPIGSRPAASGLNIYV